MKSNREMIKELVEGGYADDTIAAAMLKVDRSGFVPEDMASMAYDDTPIPIGFGQTTSAPSIIAFMLKVLEIREGMRVLEIGTGSGYQTALLSLLVGPKGRVISTEIVPELASTARERLLRHRVNNVEILNTDASEGYAEHAPYDRIVCSAAFDTVPKAIIEQLAEHGRMVVPVGGAFEQYLYLVSKENGEISEKALMPVLFVSIMKKE